jgi:hypothetical protein
MGMATPLARGQGSDPASGLSAPIAYEDLMLVLVSKEGAAAVIFDEVNNDGNAIQYNFRYESADGKKKLSGTGKLFERRLDDDRGYDPEGLSITSGPVSIKWSRGSRYRGWIYYAPEVVTVHLAHAENFKSHEQKIGFDGETIMVKELDLRRFLKK